MAVQQQWLKWFAFSVFSASLSFSTEPALAGGARRPAQPTSAGLKRVVLLKEFSDRYVDLPNGGGLAPVSKAYGRNVFELLRARLDLDGGFIVMNPLRESQILASSTIPADPVIFPIIPVVGAEIEGAISEVSFQTGERAERTYYGFSPRMNNEFAVSERQPNMALNEFLNSEQKIFGKTFDDFGDLFYGMDLGSTLNFDVLWVGAHLKWANYLSRMSMELTIRHQLDSTPRRRIVSAQGEGYYFSVGASYMGYGAVATVANRKAMLEAFNNTVQGLVQAIRNELSQQPVLSTLVGPGPGGALYVAAGALNLGAYVGQRWYSRSAWEQGKNPTVFQITKVYQTISEVQIINSTSAQQAHYYSLGDRLVSLASGEAVPPLPPQGTQMSAQSAGATLGQSVQLPSTQLSLANELKQFEENPVVRFFKGLAELVTLPFRIARYLQYDQEYQGGEFWQADLNRARSLARAHWPLQMIGAPQAWQTSMGRNDMVVAVLDTGVDYNHQDLRRNIYFDGLHNSPGYDFFSGDPRPYDDHAHGSAVAGVIAGGGWQIMGVAPRVSLLPIKVFSPRGDTTSAALRAGFDYAISQRAKVIVCGWATHLHSQALREGIEAARAQGIFVVTAAGDQGADLGRSAYFPASLAWDYDNVITVAGVDRNRQVFERSGPLELNSNFGGPVELAAPGADVMTAFPRNGYQQASFTGVAAAYVAGGAAMLWSACPSAEYRQIKQVLLDGADTWPSLNGKVRDNKAFLLNKALEIMKTRCSE